MRAQLYPIYPHCQCFQELLCHYRGAHRYGTSISRSISWEMLNLDDVLYALDNESKLPTEEILLLVLQETATKKDLQYAKRVYAHLCRTTPDVQISLSSHVISMFIECGCLETAKHVYNQSQNHDRHTWKTLFFGYVQCGRFDDALNTYRKMQENGALACSSFTSVTLLKVCARLNVIEQGQLVHAAILCQGYEKDIYVGSMLVDMYAKCGFIFDARIVFDKILCRNIVSWNTLIAGYAQIGARNEMVKCLKIMELEGISPNAVTFTSILKAHCNSKRGIREICNEIVQKGYETDMYLCSSLVDQYAKCGSPIEAQEIFDKLPVRDIISWTTLIAGYAEHGPGQRALICFYRMQSEGICPDAAIFASVLKACGSIPDKDMGQELHTEIIIRGFETDPFVSCTLIDMYTKCLLFSDARQLFSKQVDQNVVSWNALIVGYTEDGSNEEALNCFKQMQAITLPNAVSYSSVLKALGIIGAFNEGLEVHKDIIQKGIEHDIFVGNSLVDLYAKCGSMFEAEHVFSRLISQTVVSWTALIAGYVENGPTEKSLNHFEQMETVNPDATLFSCVLKACSSLNDITRGRSIHRLIVITGLESQILIGNSLIDMYVKCGSLEDAQEAFDRLSSKSVVSWTMLIAAYADHGLGQKAFCYFEEMKVEKIIPDATILTCALKSCENIEALDKGQDLHNDIIQRGLEVDEVVGSSLVDLYTKFNSVLEAEATFNMLKSRSIVVWNALLTGYAECGCYQEAIYLFDEMKSKNICPDAITYVMLLKTCDNLCDVEKGSGFHREIIQKGLEVDPFVGNSLVNMYAKCGVLSEAQQVFNRLQVQSIISWNALIVGYAEHGLNQDALVCYDLMKKAGVTQTSISSICGLKACGNIGAIDKARKIHVEIVQGGFEMDVSISSMLVDTYTKCGSLIDARRVFDKLCAPDIVAWNAIIKGYGLNHDGKTAMQFYMDMQDQGVLPNSVTFICILTACSHNSLVIDGQKYFKMMIEKYNIIPCLDHFSCMVDLFARSGRLLDAEKFLETLPLSSSKDMWLPLLSACKTYIEVDIGYRCYQKLVHIDPDCGAAYMLMSSIYASAGRWDDVERMQEIRNHAGSVKYSSL